MNNDTIRLDKPGAGLPFVQRILIKLWIGPYISQRTPWPAMDHTYIVLVEKIIKSCESISPNDRKKKVLVPPIPGLEDSSRFWSINMVLEHLMIVSTNVEKIILSLSSNNSLDLVVDIAKVKPPENENDTLPAFKNYAPSLLTKLNEKMVNRDSRATHFHPWFGQMNLRQWYWLLGSHLQIHWRQIKEIRKKL